MSVTVNGTSGIVFNDSTTQGTSAFYGGLAFRNRIINGAMVIDQRNAGASVTQNTSIQYSVDRWYCYGAVTSKFTIQQNAGSVTPPTGFINYLGCTSSSAYSVGSSDEFNVSQRIEGLNVADLGFGTANASTVTLSFWVRSSLTGTFGGSLYNSGNSRSYPFTYTISSANTWEQKSITVAGDTSGTWLTTNGLGLGVNFSLGAGTTRSGTAGAWASANYASATGATSVVGTSGATFYITGVQLEKGSTATSFDYRPYGTELQLAQRYYQTLSCFSIAGYASGNGESIFGNSAFKVSMRAQPTVTITSAGTTSRLSSFSVNATSTEGVSFQVIANAAGFAGVYGTPTATSAIEL